MKAFNKYTNDERRQFVDAFLANGGGDFPALWMLPWMYAGEWMVDATTPAQAAVLWLRLWFVEMAAFMNPTRMEVFYA